MKAIRSVMLAALALIPAAALAGETRPCVLLHYDGPRAVLSGNARIDFAQPGDPAAMFQEGAPAVTEEGRKSPWLAAGLSAVVPGAGEFYSESYIKSAAFFAAEIALWAFANAYDHRGDRQTDFFQNYANAHWNVVTYAQYAQSNYAPPGGSYQWLIPGTQGDPPWMRVNWAELNRMETDIGATAPGSYYSHQLPAYNTQQYYELIGKYPQFNQGWDDAPASFSYGGIRSQEALYYDGQRGQANNYYTTASTFVGIAVVNHVVSAIDAALTAGSYNRGLHASVGSQIVPSGAGGAAVPVLHLAWGF